MRQISSTTEPAAALTSAPDLLDLTVVIVNYNVREFLEQALRSVLRAGEHLSSEVFVVDNNSVDGSVEMVRSRFPSVHVIANDQNLGFSRANNQAIRQSRGRHILILNPDTIVQEDTLTKLLDFMQRHPRAGAVGCKILHPDGSFARESRRAFPRPSVAFYRLVGLSSLFPRSRVFGRYNMTYLPEDEVAEVDALSGSCMLVRRAAIESAFDGRNNGSGGAGLLDEDFFMYGEDLDWCYRIQEAGWKIYYTPETQIIHYKGESTKKGELRYVRLFYGAMLRFTRKHFRNRYSAVLEVLLRTGILLRAGVSVIAEAVRRFSWPLIDFSTVYGTAAMVAGAHAAALGADVSPLFFVAVAPAYALGAVTGIAATGGYDRKKRIRSVWAGTFVGLLVVATVSFFVKDIAFSRAVILLIYPISSSFTTALRLLHRGRRLGASRTSRALLVGHHREAVRLQQMLARHPRPPLVLQGYIESDHPESNGHSERRCPPLLGGLNHLRDIVRLRQIDDVVFASAALSNRTIFGLIQQLRDLPVHFRILAEGRDHVIGKAAVDDLSMVNLLEAEETFVQPRSPAARRSFDVAIALVGLLLHPLLLVVERFGGEDSLAVKLSTRTRRMPHIFTGQRAIIGYHENGIYTPPREWNLSPGIFAVDEAIEPGAAGPDEIASAYWFYVRNQSASLDWDILVRSLRLLSERQA